MKVDPGSGLRIREVGFRTRLRAKAAALREAERKAYRESLASGLCGVLVLEAGELTKVGVHTGIPHGASWRRDDEPAGQFLPATVRVFAVLP